jgi:hypothetical protein
MRWKDRYVVDDARSCSLEGHVKKKRLCRHECILCQHVSVSSWKIHPMSGLWFLVESG